MAMEDKSALIDKILEMFKRYGIRSVTTNDIARELGISKKTLYEHFTDKSDVIEQAMLLLYERLSMQLDEVRQKKLGAIQEVLEINKRLSDMLRTTSPTLDYDLRKYYPDLFCKVFNAFNTMVYQMHVENMNRGMAEGVYRMLDPDVIARLLSHRMQTGFLEVFTLEEFYSERVRKEVFLYHLFGICNDKGYAIVNSMLDDFFTSK
jgi:AcrR family transcriptional regulator